MIFSLKKFPTLLALCSVMLLGMFSPEAQAIRTFALRYSTNTNGNIVQTGNTIMDCSACGVINNSSTMRNLNKDSDPSTFNSSSADLVMPAGANVLFAGLYWGAQAAATTARNQVLLKTPGGFGYTAITASQLDTGGQANEYGGFADVTSLVNAGGSGTYWAANIQTTSGVTATWGGWSLIVVYAHNSELLNNLSVFDGYQSINNATGITVPVSGFLTPLSGPVVSRVALIGWDGDSGAAGGTYTGDSFLVNNVALYDNCNPTSNDYFNSTICNLGVPNEARNPNTATYPAGMVNTLGVDIDISNIPSGVIPNGATSATLKFTTTGEVFGAHAVAFATNLYVPNITSNVVKTVQDLNGGDLLVGDTLRYTISMSNTGQDTATDVILTDNIPAYTTYKPNSLNVVSGPNTGVKTDASADDQAEYISTGTPRVVFRLGTGANATLGGQLPFFNPPPAQTSITFDVTVNSGIPTGTLISNSASVSYKGQTIPANTYGTSSSAATAAVLTPPVLAKSFTPSTIDVNGVSQLKIIVSNPASNAGTLNNVIFSDTYPAGLVNATPANSAITCTAGSTAGTLTGGVAGGNTLGMTPGATLLVGGSCTLTVNVTSALANNYINSTGAPSASNGGTGSTASATLSVGKPSISKAFATSPILAGASSRLTLTLSNGLATSLTGVAFTDTYPSGLVNAAIPNVVSTCGGTVTATAGAGVISLANGILASTSICTVSVDVTSSSAGIYANTSGGISSTQTGAAGNGSNTTSLTVIGAPQAIKSFSPSSVGINVISQLSIKISNPNTTAALTGVSFTDTYPALLLNTVTPNATLNCTSGSTATLIGGAASGASIGISSGSLAAGGSCTVVVNVSSATAGNYLNSTGTIASANGGTGTAATATLNVTNLVAPTITKAFAPATITLNGTSVLTITLANANASPITGATFTDTYPFSVDNAATPATSTTCALGTVSAVAGGGSITLSGGTIPAAGNCTVTVTVTSATAGSYDNTIPVGGLTTGNAGVNAVATTATLTVLAPPTITKSFTPTSVAVNTNSLMTITLTNSNAVALTGVAFTDTYPALLLNNGAVVSNTCTAGGTAGTVTSVAGGNTLNYTTGTIAANGSCTITRNVQSTTAGSYANTTGTVSSTNGGTGLTASATLSVGRPSITKTFAPTTVNTGGTSVLTITLSNPTAAAMTLAAFTDTYPAGILNASAPTASTTCALGTVTAVSLGSSVALSGGTIPATGSCTVTVSVTATATNTNTIPVGGLTVSGGASNASAASATLTVNPAPITSKSFSPSSIAKNGTSTLTISVQNANNAAMTGVAFTDTYPAGLVNAAAPTVTATPATCTFTTLTAAAGGNSFALTGGTIPLNSTCIYTVQVTSATEGTYLNNTGAVTSTNYGIGTASTATLNVIPNPPTTTKAFSPATIAPNATSTMTITLTNPNVINITGAGFTDTYPAGLVNTNSPAVNTTCVGGTVSATSNGNTVQLTGATIPANGSCVVTVNVTSTLDGTYNNNTGTITTGNAGNGASASGTLTVASPPTVTKAFATTPIAIGGSSVLTITVNNSNTAATLTGLALTDTYPTNVVNAAVPAVSTTCGGTATAAAGGSNVTLSGGTLAAATSCTVTVTVTSSVTGTYNNTIATGGVTTTNAGANTNPASATLAVFLPPLTVAKAFAPASVAANTNSILTITLTNPNAVAVTGTVFTDTYPAGLTNAATPAASTTCASGVVTAASSGGSVALSGATVPANGSCTVTVTVISAIVGAYANTIAIGGVTTTNTVANTTAASDTLTILLPAPTVVKTFAPISVGTNNNDTLTITLTNPNAVAITGAAFTDTYPSPLFNSTGGTIGNTCGGTVTAPVNGNTLTLTGGAIPANGSCAVSYNRVRSGTTGAYTNSTGPITSTNAVTAAAATAELLVGNVLDISKSFTASTIALGSNSTLTLTVTNATGGNRNTIAFTDTYPAGLVNATPLVTGGGGTCVTTNGGSITAAAGGNSVQLNPTTINLTNGGTCTVTISVTSAVAGTYTNTVPTGGLTSNGGFSNPSPASATLTVTATPPTVAKAFSPGSISVGGTSVLTITLTNANAVAITGAAFTDTYPAGLVNTGTASPATTCGGTATAANNGNTLQLAGGTIPAGGSCTVTVNVTSATPGSYSNTLAAGTVTSTNAGNSAVAGTSTLTVTGTPSLTFLKTVTIYSDPANGVTNPKFIPGAVANYTLRVINSGTGSVDNNTTVITDPIPANTASFVNDIGGVGSGPISFTQGTPSSTLTYTFTALNSLTDDASFSNDNGVTWTYIPIPGADGCDPLVTNLRLNPKGIFVGGNTSFDLNFRVCVK